MEERTSGVVLRTRPLTETSLIIQWLTPDLGRISTVARGARRPKSPFRGKLDLFYVADFSLARSRRSDLHTLREVTLRETHPALRQDITSLHQACYCASLIVQTTETETPLPEIFALLRYFLARLASGPQPPTPLLLLAFETRLLLELGQAPAPGPAELGPAAREIFRNLLEPDWPALNCLKPSPAQFLELQRFLHQFLLQHLGKVPPGRARALPE